LTIDPHAALKPDGMAIASEALTRRQLVHSPLTAPRITAIELSRPTKNAAGLLSNRAA